MSHGVKSNNLFHFHVLFNRVATFRFRLNSLCFPCVHDQFPCVFQYISNKYYFFTNGLHHPLQPFFPPFYSTIILQVKLSPTITHYHVNSEKLHHLVATLITKISKNSKFSKFSLCWHSFPCVKKKILLNSLCFPCLEKLTAKFPVFPVP